MVGRVIPKKLPACPGRDSRFSIKHNSNQPDNPWWVFYDDEPADHDHCSLIELVNSLKQDLGSPLGGGFSINEHQQVMARMQAPPGYGNKQSIHVIGVEDGEVSKYHSPLTFKNGRLDPRVQPCEGDAWIGPHCGATYSFAAPGNPKPPSGKL